MIIADTQHGKILNKKGCILIMTNREKELIMKVTSDLRKLNETKSLTDLVRYMDYVIILSKELNYSDEFMEKLYFMRYYIDKVAC